MTMTADPGLTEAAAARELFHDVLELAEEWDRPYHQAREALHDAVGLNTSPSVEITLTRTDICRLEDTYLWDEHQALLDLVVRIAPAAHALAEELAPLGVSLDAMANLSPERRHAFARRIFERAGITDRLMTVAERHPGRDEQE